jgi:beta-lactamase superfamily II metal-dependent hydrolase
MPDQALANGSSIAFLAEYAGKRALLLGDAHPDVVARSLGRLCKARGVRKFAVDAVKVAHHGSKANTNAALLQRVASPSYLISTNGDQFKHPDAPCIARILRDGRPRRLYFNYESAYTTRWLADAAQKKHDYQAIVRAESELSMNVVL